MNGHAYHEDFKKARSNYDRQTSSPTAITKIPPDSTESQSTSIPPDQIQFRDPIENYPEAPVAKAIEQNVVPPTPTTVNIVRPMSIN